jgi:hypothetical protein
MARPYLLLVATAMLSFTCTRKEEPAPQTATPALGPPAPPAEESIEEKVAKAESLAEATRLVHPALMMLIPWAARKLRWEDVAVADEISISRVFREDEMAVLGKRMCVPAEILEIERRDIRVGIMYGGLARIGEWEKLGFFAMGAIGKLGPGSSSRFCGLVTGVDRQTVDMIGMFDLPENRTPIVEQ